MMRIESRRLSLNTLRRTLRLHQWAKNGLVLVPLLLGGRALQPPAWGHALLGVLALGLVASGSYIVNDLLDLEADRAHSTKRLRPLASGAMSIRLGAIVSGVCLIAGLGLAALISNAALAAVLLYLVVTLAYSFALKQIPILDVFVIAGLFTLRLFLGVVVANVVLSPWLLVFSMFVFMSLSMAKRHTEVLHLGQRGLKTVAGRGYRADDAPITLGIGLAAMGGSVLILVLYLIEDAFPRGFYVQPAFLWAWPAILFLFLGRIWLLSQRGEMNDDPVAFALKDKTSLLLGASMGVAFLLAVVGPR